MVGKMREGIFNNALETKANYEENNRYTNKIKNVLDQFRV